MTSKQLQIGASQIRQSYKDFSQQKGHQNAIYQKNKLHTH